MANTEIRLIIFAAKDGEALYSQHKQDQELTGSDHEVLTDKFRLKLKKVGKITRPFRYGLNQIPYDYTVEVTNRFKGLDMIDRMPDELWTEVHDIIQETGKMVCSFHLFKNFPQFVVIHTVKGFSMVNETEVDVLFVLFCFVFS